MRELTKAHKRRTVLGPQPSDSSIGARDRMTEAAVAAALAAAHLSTFLAGGSQTPVKNAFYFPIILAAVRLGAGGALVTSILAGVLVGPLIPLDVEAGTSAATADWVARALLFVVVGQFAAFLSRHSSASISDEISGRSLRREILRAIAEKEIRLEYQPIVELTTGEIVGAEALVRWDHPTAGSVPPDQFIRRAERAGCMPMLSRFVVDEACRRLAGPTWTELAARGLRLSINLSAVDLDDRQLVDFIGERLAAMEVAPGVLYCEITETALVSDVDAACDWITALQSLGVHVVMDDFGAGQSSLGQLGRLPVEAIKIDRAFVVNMEQQENGDIMFAGIVSLARDLGVDQVVEGIETPSQAEMVERTGCRWAQGFLFAPSLLPAVFEDLAKRRVRLDWRSPDREHGQLGKDTAQLSRDSGA